MMTGGQSPITSEARRSSLFGPDGRRIRSSRITEEELFKGNKSHERKMEGKLEHLLKTDRQLSAKLENIQGLVKDIHQAAKRGK